MIRLIPLLATFVVLLWHPTEGWSEESDTLLEPDAVLTGLLPVRPQNIRIFAGQGMTEESFYSFGWVALRPKLQRASS